MRISAQSKQKLLIWRSQLARPYSTRSAASPAYSLETKPCREMWKKKRARVLSPPPDITYREFAGAAAPLSGA